MLTPRQKEVLDFIQSYIKTHGVGPTLTEIDKQFHMGSASAAHQHVEALLRKGFLKKLPNQARAISMNEHAIDFQDVPLLGRIALGEPIDSGESSQLIKVPRILLSSSGQHYALEAKGDSMNEDGILDGDILIVKHTNIADNGDVVVARVAGDKSTLKKFYDHGDKIELRPKSNNSTHKSQFYQYGEVEIQGKFSGLIRKG